MIWAIIWRIDKNVSITNVKKQEREDSREVFGSLVLQRPWTSGHPLDGPPGLLLYVLYILILLYFIIYHYLYFHICRSFCWHSSWSGGHPLNGPPGLLLLWTLEGVEWHLLNFYFSKIGPPSIILPRFYREDAQYSFTTIFIPRRQHNMQCCCETIFDKQVS